MERGRPERYDDDGWLSAGGYESDDEEKDEEGDERSTCALTLSCQCITVLVQVRLHNHHLQIMVSSRRRDHLSALNACAVRIVSDLRGRKHVTVHMKNVNNTDGDNFFWWLNFQATMKNVGILSQWLSKWGVGSTTHSQGVQKLFQDPMIIANVENV